MHTHTHARARLHAPTQGLGGIRIGDDVGGRMGGGSASGGPEAGSRVGVLVHPDDAVRRLKAFVEVENTAPARAGLAGPSRATGAMRRAAELEQVGQRGEGGACMRVRARGRVCAGGTLAHARTHAGLCACAQEFWSRMSHVISDKGSRVWRALDKQLERYLRLLQTRATNLADVDSLQHQNNELRALLNQYLSSRINEELEIPPTQII